MIRVVLIDDQTLVRHGIQSLLSIAEDIEVVAEASDGEAGLERIADTRPDVVLLDWRMPRLGGLGVLERLKHSDFFPPTLILTTFDDDEILLEGLRAGAKGYLLKDVTLHDLLEAIRTLAHGGTLIQPAVTERILQGLLRLHTKQPDLETPEALTSRETEILRLMAGGYSNREIAGLLGITEGTVKTHVSTILAKLGVRDRTRAVLRGLEMGWV
jgi:DNA-binding NarL/FixJ family response regulator